MSATATQDIHLERTVAGLGLIEFEQSVDRSGKERRAYWFTAEGNVRRRRMPSVTGIISSGWPKPALLEWYARHGADAEGLLEDASRRGKAVHQFVQTYMESGELLDPRDFPEHYRPFLRGAAAFLWEYDPQPLAVEQLIVHPELGYAGRLDLIAQVAHKRTLLDFKTNPKGRIYTEAHVQATGYVAGYERCGGDPVEQVLLVGISDQGAFNVVEGADADKLWGALLAFYGEVKRFEKALDGGREL